MFTQRQTYLRNGLLSSVAALLLLTTAGQSAVLTNDLQTTVTAPTTQPDNSTMETPVVLPLHRPCGGEHEKYCENGGKCMYPQDSDKPSCICTPLYSGPRCLFFSDQSHSEPELEKLIGISFGVAMLIMALAIIIYCYASKRCVKSAPLIKSAPSETSV
ncbi:epigen [Anabas testudineus]|uniref:EGF-like domain-containing protein n=1 Tax=Anabas testudineus TaxID=64144 RepID=A0A3Q1JHN8_ANATE|nr:epigen [Anabas testudineus]